MRAQFLALVVLGTVTVLCALPLIRTHELTIGSAVAGIFAVLSLLLLVFLASVEGSSQIDTGVVLIVILSTVSVLVYLTIYFWPKS
jgi:hypothetical protein